MPYNQVNDDKSVPSAQRGPCLSKQEIAFAIRGMWGPKNAGEIQTALACLDGVVAARVNYATERATVVYDPVRVTASQMVSAVQNRGYYAPLEHLTLSSQDLVYATSGGTVERALVDSPGVVRACADLARCSVTLEILPDKGRRTYPERVLKGLGFRPGEADPANARNLFLVRSALLVIIEFLALWSAGAHAGWLSPSVPHTPILIVVLSFITLFAAGLPFYRSAFDAAVQGQFDMSVLVAFMALLAAVGGFPFGILLPVPWLTDAGLVTATALTTGWFVIRGLTIWVLPHLRDALIKRKTKPVTEATSVSTTPPQLGVVPNGSRR